MARYSGPVIVHIVKDDTENFVKFLATAGMAMSKTLAEKYAARMRGSLHGPKSGATYKRHGVTHQASAPGEAPAAEPAAYRQSHTDTATPQGDSMGRRARRESRANPKLGTKRIPRTRMTLAAPDSEQLEASIRAVPVRQNATYAEWGITMHRKGFALEFGTAHIAGRPFVAPALAQWREDAEHWWKSEILTGGGGRWSGRPSSGGQFSKSFAEETTHSDFSDVALDLEL